MPTADGQMHATSAIEMHGFHPGLLSSNTFQAPNAFAQQQSYAPSTFVHQNTGFEGIDAAHNISPKQEVGVNIESQQNIDMAPYTIRSFDPTMPSSGDQSSDQ